MIIEFILGAGSLIVDIIGKGFANNKSKRADVSEDLLNISEILEKIAGELEQNRCPFMECSAMNVLTKTLIEKIENTIDSDLTKMLEEALEHFSHVEEFNACENLEETAKHLKIAAGKFLAASLMAKY